MASLWALESASHTEDEQMSTSFVAKTALSIATAAAMMVFVSETCFAGIERHATGKIITYSIDPSQTTRGGCVKMNVTVTNALGGYLCNFYSFSNNLFRPLEDTLKDAYLSGRTCYVDYIDNDVNYASIKWLECQ
jgi:hypothetical protein